MPITGRQLLCSRADGPSSWTLCGLKTPQFECKVFGACSMLGMMCSSVHNSFLDDSLLDEVLCRLSFLTTVRRNCERCESC